MAVLHVVQRLPVRSVRRAFPFQLEDNHTATTEAQKDSWPISWHMFLVIC